MRSTLYGECLFFRLFDDVKIYLQLSSFVSRGDKKGKHVVSSEWVPDFSLNTLLMTVFFLFYFLLFNAHKTCDQ